MRELKFRAWSNDNNKMWYVGSKNGYEYFTATLDFCIDWSVWRSREKVASSDRGDILMEWTGLKDKNGREIYENDIIEGILPNGDKINVRRVVEWCDRPGYLPFIIANSLKEIEVIGNKFENPNLLNNLI